MNPSLRILCSLMVGLIVSIFAGGVFAQEYPSRPIKIVIPLPSGGATDVLAREVARRVSERWRVPIIVESKPGASTMIATADVAKSAPDGYTLLFTYNAFVLSALIYEKPLYRINELAPVGSIAETYFVFWSTPAAAGGSPGAFFKQPRNKQLTFASIGIGSTTHLLGEQLKAATKLDLLHVPYKGQADIVPAMLGGQIDTTFLAPSGVVDHERAGRLSAITVAAPRRLDALPNVPTLTELGIKGMERGSFFGFLVPAKTPRPIIDKWVQALREVHADPTFKARLDDFLMLPVRPDAEGFARDIQADVEAWGPLIKQLGLKLE